MTTSFKTIVFGIIIILAILVILGKLGITVLKIIGISDNPPLPPNRASEVTAVLSLPSPPL